MIDVVVPAGALLGECPLWSVSEQRLYWIDIDGRAVHRFDPISGIDEMRETVGRPGSIALTGEPGRLVMAAEHQVGWFSWEGAVFTPWIDLEPSGTGNRLNDGRCDAAGRFWVGSMYEDVAVRRSTGMLHRVDGAGETNTVRRDIGVSNGLAFSPDNTTMYFADSFANTVWAFDYDATTGTQSNERVFIDFAGNLAGSPDGACVDEDGCYWVACVDGAALARVTPVGDVDRIIELPVARPTMPAFGGPDLTTIFVTSIRVGGTAPRQEDDGRGGSLLAISAGVRGLPEPAFDV